MDIRPNPGPQEQFLSSPADIVIYGGQAGGGKTMGLLLEPLRHIRVPGFSAVIFRRTTPQIKNPGGLWDTAHELYPSLGGVPREQPLDWVWPTDGSTKAIIKFGHMEHEKDKHDWQGSQIPLIGWDELTHFTRSQFFYMLSRNRSTCGVKPYMRATCNPDADSWVAELIAWWIDQDTGFPIPERAGVIRWFVNIDDTLHWAGSRQALIDEFGDECEPKSLTFIPASIYDNPQLLEKDPGYLANLKALPRVERERLLGGNWKIRPAAGLYFNRANVEIVDAAPPLRRQARYWDLAATPKTQSNDPDWTVGIRMAAAADGRYVITHAFRMREAPGKRDRLMKNIGDQDGIEVALGFPQDPGQAGKDQAQKLVQRFAGHNVRTRRETGDKLTRFAPFSAQVEAGNVVVLRAPWNEWLFAELEAFPESLHDDAVDACAGAFEMLTGGKFGFLDLMEEDMREQDERRDKRGLPRIKPDEPAPAAAVSAQDWIEGMD